MESQNYTHQLKQLERELAVLGGINQPGALFSSCNDLKGLDHQDIHEDTRNHLTNSHNNDIRNKVDQVHSILNQSRQKLVQNMENSRNELEFLRESLSKSQHQQHQQHQQYQQHQERSRFSNFSQSQLQSPFSSSRNEGNEFEREVEKMANTLMVSYENELRMCMNDPNAQIGILRRMLDQELRKRLLGELEKKHLESTMAESRNSFRGELATLRMSLDDQSKKASNQESYRRQKDHEVEQIKRKYRAEKKELMKKLKVEESQRKYLEEKLINQETHWQKQLEEKKSIDVEKLRDSRRALSLKCDGLQKNRRELIETNKELETKLLKLRRSQITHQNHSYTKSQLLQNHNNSNENNSENNENVLEQFTMRNPNVVLRWDNMDKRLEELVKSSLKGSSTYRLLQQLIQDLDSEKEERQTLELEMDNFELVNKQRIASLIEIKKLRKELSGFKTQEEKYKTEIHSQTLELADLKVKNSEFESLQDGLLDAKTLKEKLLVCQRRVLFLEQGKRRLISEKKRLEKKFESLQTDLDKEIKKKDQFTLAKLHVDKELKLLQKKYQSLEKSKVLNLNNNNINNSNQNNSNSNNIGVDVEEKYQIRITELELKLEEAEKCKQEIIAYNEVLIKGLQSQIEAERELRMKLEVYSKELEDELLKPHNLSANIKQDNIIKDEEPKVQIPPKAMAANKPRRFEEMMNNIELGLDLLDEKKQNSQLQQKKEKEKEESFDLDHLDFDENDEDLGDFPDIDFDSADYSDFN